jgi:hypothetical protein
MRRWKSPRFILSMTGFLVSVCFFVASVIDINPAGAIPDSRRVFASYLGSPKPIGSGRCDEGYYAPDGGKEWGENTSSTQGGMICEDSIRMEIAHGPGGVSDLSGEETAKRYECLGREMHLLQDVRHSIQDSYSPGPFPERLSGE